MVAVKPQVRRLTAALSLLLALGCSRLQEHPLVVEAVAEMRANPRVADWLGTPPTASPTSSSKPRETRPPGSSWSRARRPAGSGA